MRLLFVCNEYPPAPHGGVGVFVKNIANALARRGHKVFVVGVYNSVDSFLVEKDADVMVYKLPIILRSRITHINSLQARWNLASFVHKLVRDEGIEIVEAPEGGGWSLFIQKKKPVIVRLHNSSPIFYQNSKTQKRGRFTYWIETLAIRRASRIVAVSRYILEALTPLYPYARIKKGKRPTVIYNGIRTDFFQEISDVEEIPYRIAFAGTIKPMKNLEKLLDAFSVVLEKYPQAQLHIAGKDTLVNGESYWQVLSSSLSEMVLSHIEYHGTFPYVEMPAFFALAQVCVFPSVVESFGLVAAEAMACGRPVIYTENGPGPELIDHGVDGFLVDTSSSDAIAQQIIEVFDFPEQAMQVGQQAAKKIKKCFSEERVIEENLNLYQDCLSK